MSVSTPRRPPAVALAIALSRRYRTRAESPHSNVRRIRPLRSFASLLTHLAPLESYGFWEEVRVGADYGVGFWGSYESTKVHPELSRAELIERRDLALRMSDAAEHLIAALEPSARRAALELQELRFEISRLLEEDEDEPAPELRRPVPRYTPAEDDIPF